MGDRAGSQRQESPACHFKGMRKFLLIAAGCCYFLYRLLCWGADEAQTAGAAAIERDESRVSEIVE
jgi:hypothetical protein